MLKISLFGSFRISDGDSGAVVFPTRSANALFAYLALGRGSCIYRAELARALWPEKSSDAAKTNLRTTLYQIRATLSGSQPIVADRTTVALDPGVVETDFDRADRLRRTFVLAPDQPAGIAAASQEWQLRRREILEDWDYEWLETSRRRAWLQANELGCDLAKALEESGDPPAALEIWREILLRAPNHAEALKHAIRLEYQLHGKARAAELAQQVTREFSKNEALEMPGDLKRTLRDIQIGALEAVAEPQFIRKRSELFLLARMFESNLTSSSQEALGLVARECENPANSAHPRAMLSLLSLALSHTEGRGSERIKLAAQVGLLASWSSEFELGHKWVDFVLDNTGETDFYHHRARISKGFLFFEQRQYGAARKELERAVADVARLGLNPLNLVATSNLAGVQWHELEFDKAIASYQRVLDTAGESSDPSTEWFSASAHGNLAFVFAVMRRWQEAIVHGRECQAMSEKHPLYGMVASVPLGLALFANGEKRQGLQEMIRAVNATSREGMARFNQIAVDFAAVVLSLGGRPDFARHVLDGNSEHRFALRHLRSPAEHQLILLAGGIDPDKIEIKSNPLRGQSAATLSLWACEELQRAAANLP